MNLSPTTIALLQDCLERRIEDFYDDPDECLNIKFDKQEDVWIVSQEVAKMRIAAREIGLDFDKVISDPFVVHGVERLKQLIQQAQNEPKHNLHTTRRA